MIDATVHTRTPTASVAVRIRAPVADLGELFGTHLANVAHGIADRGGQPAGAPYGRYHAMDAEEVDLEIGVPIAAPIGDLRPLADCEPGEMGSSELPGGEVAVTVHHGSYDGLSRTYPALQAWIGEQGRTIGGAPWESYVDDPFEVAEADLRTEVCWPLV
ncbi:MAG: GyrI-like domain-containing protein [Chloroflexi bacterium]|nr:GyrI-like domain-containing protein [Chloroflexota bacterium]